MAPREIRCLRPWGQLAHGWFKRKECGAWRTLRAANASVAALRVHPVDYRPRILEVDLMVLEAKGPRCTLSGHVAELVVLLGDSMDLELDRKTKNAA